MSLPVKAHVFPVARDLSPLHALTQAQSPVVPQHLLFPLLYHCPGTSPGLLPALLKRGCPQHPAQDKSRAPSISLPSCPISLHFDLLIFMRCWPFPLPCSLPLSLLLSLTAFLSLRPVASLCGHTGVPDLQGWNWSAVLIPYLIIKVVFGVKMLFQC